MRMNERGSIPLALLASIIVGGLVIVLVATVVQSERTVRFDRAFTNVVQAADAGVQDAYHQLSVGHIDLDAANELWPKGPFFLSSNGMEVEWTIDKVSPRAVEVTSSGRTPDGVVRTVVSRIEKDALFFPGAFGDQLIGVQAQSTEVDSYNSSASDCGTGTPTECWGPNPFSNLHGTEQAAIGTNGDFDFTGGDSQVLRAILYDWLGNPPDKSKGEAPGYSRCKATGGSDMCSDDVLDMVEDPLTFSDEMASVKARLSDESCEGRWLHEEAVNPTPASDLHNGLEEIYQSTNGNVTYLGDGRQQGDPAVLVPYSASDESNPDGSSAADLAWDNYWCAESLQVRNHVEVNADDAPVVIFVRDSYAQDGHRVVGWPSANNSGNWQQKSHVRSQGPVASDLQIFVAADTAGSTSNVSIAQQSVFAGVIYAPQSVCAGKGGQGGGGGAGVHVYGSIICSTLSNVGNWHFHYDEVLGEITRDDYTLATWREEAPES